MLSKHNTDETDSECYFKIFVTYMDEFATHPLPKDIPSYYRQPCHVATFSLDIVLSLNVGNALPDSVGYVHISFLDHVCSVYVSLPGPHIVTGLTLLPMFTFHCSALAQPMFTFTLRGHSDSRTAGRQG